MQTGGNASHAMATVEDQDSNSKENQETLKIQLDCVIVQAKKSKQLVKINNEIAVTAVVKSEI